MLSEEHFRARAEWTKSSYSGTSGDCVEWARVGDVTGIRDGKHPAGAILLFTSREISAFRKAVISGEF
ncbi:MAG: DUF397 domain-containing protein [Streptosporangiales bacterium]|nr:DUF397 domain-containing protein [Streptosporangiales bacterium]